MYVKRVLHQYVYYMSYIFHLSKEMYFRESSKNAKIKAICGVWHGPLLKISSESNYLFPIYKILSVSCKVETKLN